jgi:hypothetical protein
MPHAATLRIVGSRHCPRSDRALPSDSQPRRTAKKTVRPKRPFSGPLNQALFKNISTGISITSRRYRTGSCRHLQPATAGLPQRRLQLQIRPCIFCKDAWICTFWLGDMNWPGSKGAEVVAFFTTVINIKEL